MNELLAYTTQDNKLLNIDAYIDGMTVYLDFENNKHYPLLPLSKRASLSVMLDYFESCYGLYADA